MADREQNPGSIGPYRLIGRLGHGGVGEVFQAFDTRLERHVALKRLRGRAAGESGEDLRREARAVARLNHPHLMHIHDLLETGEGDWLVLELVEGEPLSLRVQRGPIELGTALGLAADTADGLAALHDAGLLHNDLKAENVMVTPAGRAKLVDFGLAASLGGSALDPGGEAPVRGTPRIMSPERIRGQAPDVASDLFSLGVLIYEVVTGRSPWRGPGPAETLALVMTEEPAPLRELAPQAPRELVKLVHGLLEREPGKRLASASHVLESLRSLGTLASEPGVEESSRQGPPAPGADLPQPAAGREAGLADPAVDGEPSGSQGAPESRGWRPRALRRFVTVLACRLGSRGEELEAEALVELLPAFQSAAASLVDRRGGHLVHLSGHRLVICFGYPRALEHGAELAITAAKELVGELSELPAMRRLGARIGVGIHSGPALELEDARRRLVLGPTADRARQLEEKASSKAGEKANAGEMGESPGVAGQARILVSREAAEGSCDRFELEEVEGGLEVGEALGPSWEITPPPVGRDRELAFLAGALASLDRGRGCAVLVSGEAGAGKTHLLSACRGRAVGARWLAARGSATCVAVGPALLRQALGWTREKNWTDPRRLLVSQLEGHEDSDQLVDGLAPWLEDSPTGPGSGWDGGGSARAWVAFLASQAEKRPVVLVIDDVQWILPGELEWVAGVAELSSNLPLALLLSCRPSYSWGGTLPISRLPLPPLRRAACRDLLERMAPRLEPTRREELLRRAGGAPGDLLALLAHPGGSLPATLRPRLESHLDSLGEARPVAQVLAAPEPVSFGQLVGLLGDGAQDDPEWLHAQLDRLQRAGVLERGDPRNLRFRSELLREAAWGSLLPQDQGLVLEGLRAPR